LQLLEGTFVRHRSQFKNIINEADLSSAVARLAAFHAQDSHTFDTHSGATGT